MSQIEQVVSRYRRRLLSRERLAVSELLILYRAAYARIEAELLRLRRASIAETATLEWLYQFGRLEAFQAQVQDEIRRWTYPAQLVMSALLQEAGHLGAQSAQSLLEATGLTVNQLKPFAAVHFRAIETVAGLVSADSPLAILLRRLAPDASEKAGQVLVNGVVLGQGPRETAKELKKAMGSTLSQALRISRTETVRSFRQANISVFRENEDVLSGWIWAAHLGVRTCIACLAKHGTLHPLSDVLNDHPNGRCAMIPVTDPALGLPRPGITDSKEWFDALSFGEKARHMPVRLVEAYEAGEVEFRRLAKETHHPTWGDGVTPRPLKELMPDVMRRAS